MSTGRGLTGNQLAAVAAGHRIIVPLVEFYFDSGLLLLTMGPWDITTPTGTYVHAGPLLYIKQPTEQIGSSQGLEIGMSGLDTSVITLATTEPYMGRTVRLLKAYLDPNSNAVIDSPKAWFIGRMRSMTITEDNTMASVAVQAEHYEVELTRAAPLRYTDADQQRLHPGDRGCEWAASTANTTIIWPSKQAQGG